MLPLRNHDVSPERDALGGGQVDLGIPCLLFGPGKVCACHLVETIEATDDRAELLSEHREVAPPYASSVLIPVAVVEKVQKIGQML